jgi:hypothetical protein
MTRTLSDSEGKVEQIGLKKENDEGKGKKEEKKTVRRLKVELRAKGRREGR